MSGDIFVQNMEMQYGQLCIFWERWNVASRPT